MDAYFEILLASDFTARSDRPLDRALWLAGATKGTLVIAHILEKNDGNPNSATLERLRNELPQGAQDVELVVRVGSAPKLLAQIAAERHSNLIVTGIARYNSIGDYVLGTAVDHIVRNASVPVLVVRCRAVAPYGHMVVATDLSECSRAALVSAAALFPQSVITLVHAFHVPYEGWLKSGDVKEDIRIEAQAGLDAFLAHEQVAPLKPRLKALIDEGDAVGVVLNQVKRTGADLLVLGTHGRSGFAHAAIGSQAAALLEAADLDVLMVREGKV